MVNLYLNLSAQTTSNAAKSVRNQVCKNTLIAANICFAHLLQLQEEQ